MVSTRQWNKYINNLAIVFFIFFVSCSDSNGKFNLIIKAYSNNNDKATISFNNLDNNKTINKSIKTMQDLDINLDLNSNYSIKYSNKDSDIFGYIAKIKPINYDGQDVFLTLNKNKNFRQLIHVITDDLENNQNYHYLYANNNIYSALGTNFKKLSLITKENEIINKSFNIDDNKIINLQGEYLINNKNLAFIDKNDKIKFIAHNIVNLNFLNVKYVKVNSDYFLIFNKNDGNYDCIRLNKQVNDIIKINQVENCIQTNISNDAKLLVKNNEFYLWDTDKLYKYTNSKFSLLNQFTKTGEIFQNNNEFYLIDSSNFIYLMDIENKILTKLNFNSLDISGVTSFNIDKQTTLISSKYWNAGEKYYVFENIDSQINLVSYSFPDFINLKNIAKIKIDEHQTIFLNYSSFESSGQIFNTVNFYLFSNFK